LVNFDAGELPLLLGRQTRELADEYGPSFSREIVHRDDLVVLHPALPRSGIVPSP
jgi:glutamate 5-kinase